MQNDKLVTNSFDFSSVSFSLEEVPCSVQPLSFDESLCIGCGTCARPGAISLNHPLRNRAKFVPIISQ